METGIILLTMAGSNGRFSSFLLYLPPGLQERKQAIPLTDRVSTPPVPHGNPGAPPPRVTFIRVVRLEAVAPPPKSPQPMNPRRTLQTQTGGEERRRRPLPSTWLRLRLNLEPRPWPRPRCPAPAVPPPPSRPRSPAHVRLRESGRDSAPGLASPLRFPASPPSQSLHAPSAPKASRLSVKSSRTAHGHGNGANRIEPAYTGVKHKSVCVRVRVCAFACARPDARGLVNVFHVNLH